jgi:hypothetical protein
LIRPEAEGGPTGTDLIGLRRAAISPSPPLDRRLLDASHAPFDLSSIDDHGDSLIRLETHIQMPAEFRPIAADHDEPSA